MLGFAAVIALTFVLALSGLGSAVAQEVSCRAGLVRVYWSEDGPPEDYRDSYVFNLDASDPNRVLHYLPATNVATWLQISGGSTGVPYRGLYSGDGDVANVLFRFLDIREGETVGDPVLTAMIVDMMVYWPACAKSEEVARWRKLAGP